ncbi:MAG: DUF2852 domain-containing protein, partial [Paracoccaceae bacterium]
MSFPLLNKFDNSVKLIAKQVQRLARAFVPCDYRILIAVMVAGFIFFWPVGLGILFYLLWMGLIGKESHNLPSVWKKMSEAEFATDFEFYRTQELAQLIQHQEALSAHINRLRPVK